ncbi:hypothetical protein ES703_18493 [subsurface metagenome]
MALAVVVAAGGGVVQAGIGNQVPGTGKHDKLNIVCVPHDKTADMKDGHRHALPSIGRVSAQSTLRYAMTE